MTLKDKEAVEQYILKRVPSNLILTDKIERLYHLASEVMLELRKTNAEHKEQKTEYEILAMGYETTISFLRRRISVLEDKGDLYKARFEILMRDLNENCAIKNEIKGSEK